MEQSKQKPKSTLTSLALIKPHPIALLSKVALAFSTHSHLPVTITDLLPMSLTIRPLTSPIILHLSQADSLQKYTQNLPVVLHRQELIPRWRRLTSYQFLHFLRNFLKSTLWKMKLPRRRRRRKSRTRSWRLWSSQWRRQLTWQLP